MGSAFCRLHGFDDVDGKPGLLLRARRGSARADAGNGGAARERDRDRRRNYRSHGAHLSYVMETLT